MLKLEPLCDHEDHPFCEDCGKCLPIDEDYVFNNVRDTYLCAACAAEYFASQRCDKCGRRRAVTEELSEEYIERSEYIWQTERVRIHPRESDYIYVCDRCREV